MVMKWTLKLLKMYRYNTFLICFLSRKRTLTKKTSEEKGQSAGSSSLTFAFCSLISGSTSLAKPVVMLSAQDSRWGIEDGGLTYFKVWIKIRTFVTKLLLSCFLCLKILPQLWIIFWNIMILQKAVLPQGEMGIWGGEERGCGGLHQLWWVGKEEQWTGETFQGLKTSTDLF